MQRFIHTQNLMRYVDLLESETDPVKLGQIQALLIEEEDRFGSLTERMDQADDLINDGHARLRRQQAVVAGLPPDGPDTDRAVALMATMNRTLLLMAEYRRALGVRLDGAGL